MSKNKFMRNALGQIQVPCTEVISKSETKDASQSLIFSAITMTSAVWKSGDKGTITVTFGGYDCEGCSTDASWSQIGKNSNDAYPSMNLGFIDPPYESFVLDGVRYTPSSDSIRNYCGNSGKSSCRSGWVPGATVVHEFGHAPGMMHEHQNNLFESNPIKLNNKAVIDYYNQLGMGESGAITNVIDRYDCKAGNCDYAGTKYDPKSIMLYYLPDDWIIGKNPTYPNFVLSKDDIGWLQQLYPIDNKNPPVITVKFIDRNPEPWKIAWVKKMVLDTYGKLIGVKWIFDTDIGKPSNISKTSNISKPSNIPNTTETTETPKLSGSQIAGIVICCVFIFISVCIFIYWLIDIYYPSGSRKSLNTNRGGGGEI